MSTALESIYPDYKPSGINPKSIANRDRVTRELGQFREEIAERLKVILQDLFNQYDELQGIENRERRISIYHDIRDHTKLYGDMVASLEKSAEKNEMQRAAKGRHPLVTDHGFIALHNSLSRFIHSVDAAIKNWDAPIEDKMKRDLLDQLATIFDIAFRPFLITLEDDDK